jgi:hypothetical protein
VCDPSIERFRDSAGLLCVSGVDRDGEQLPEQVAIGFVQLAAPGRLFGVCGGEDQVEV